MCFGGVDPFIIMGCPSLSLITSLVRKSALSELNRASPAFFLSGIYSPSRFPAFSRVLAVVITLAHYISRHVYPIAAVLSPLTSLSSCPQPFSSRLLPSCPLPNFTFFIRTFTWFVSFSKAAARGNFSLAHLFHSQAPKELANVCLNPFFRILPQG